MNGKRVVLALVSNILIIVCVSCVISYCFFKKSDDQQKQQLEDIAQLEREQTQQLEYITQIEGQLKVLQERDEQGQKEIAYLQLQMQQINGMTEKGRFFSISDAYKEGYLSINDLMHISYFKYEAVYTGSDPSELIEIDFDPQYSCPDLNKLVERNIKALFYEANKEIFVDKDGNSFGDARDLSLDFYGYYNGIYVVDITSDFLLHGAVSNYYFLDEVTIEYSNPYFFAFKHE